MACENECHNPDPYHHSRGCQSETFASNCDGKPAQRNKCCYGNGNDRSVRASGPLIRRPTYDREGTEDKSHRAKEKVADGFWQPDPPEPLVC